MEYNLNFISQSDFEKHVADTLSQYSLSLKSVNLKKFNSNTIDPIKLLFDKNVFNEDIEEILKMEIHRQRDKSNTNIIGYFHQNLFKYISNCEVPKNGWDVIFKSDGITYYVEMKNKHNTMNSSSSAKTFIRMQDHLLNSKDRDTSICALVEIIAKTSQDRPWVITIDQIKQHKNEQIRKISIDKFYHIVTGEKFAFRDLCMQLPKTIEKIIKENDEYKLEDDSVLAELKALGDNPLIALYQLAFSTYEGFQYIK